MPYVARSKVKRTSGAQPDIKAVFQRKNIGKIQLFINSKF